MSSQSSATAPATMNFDEPSGTAPSATGTITTGPERETVTMTVTLSAPGGPEVTTYIGVWPPPPPNWPPQGGAWPPPPPGSPGGPPRDCPPPELGLSAPPGCHPPILPPTVTVTETQTPETPTPSATAAATGAANSSKKNLGWIAAVVVPVVVLVILAIGLVWWLRRRRRKAANNERFRYGHQGHAMGPMGGMGAAAGMGAGMNNGMETEYKDYHSPPAPRSDGVGVPIMDRNSGTASGSGSGSYRDSASVISPHYPDSRTIRGRDPPISPRFPPSASNSWEQQYSGMPSQSGTATTSPHISLRTPPPTSFTDNLSAHRSLHGTSTSAVGGQSASLTALSASLSPERSSHSPSPSVFTFPKRGGRSGGQSDIGSLSGFPYPPTPARIHEEQVDRSG